MSRQMKDSGYSWIGDIPINWEVRAVKHYYKMQTGFTPDTKNESYYDDEEGFDWVTIGDLTGAKCIPTSTKSHVSLLYLQENHQPIVPKGSLLYSFKLSVGQVAFADRDVYTNEAIASFINSDDICLDFLFYSSSMIIENANENIYGAKLLNQDLIRNAMIVYPPIEEQRRIATFLDLQCAHIDTVIEKTKASIEEYKKLKQAVITQAVTKGVRGDRPMKDSGIEYIGEIPAEWKLCQVRHIGIPQNGISKGAEYFGSGFPFVSYGDVYKNIELPKQASGLIQSTDNEQELYSVKRGDIFFTRTSETIEEVGFSSVCTEDIPNATFAGFLIRVRPFDDTLYEGYSKYYFRSGHHRFYLVKEMNLVTRASLGQALLKGMPVLVPPKSEQIEIAKYLDEKCDSIDKLVIIKENAIAELETYKKSLIYEYVTGKKEVY